jgi:hypothetical protein
MRSLWRRKPVITLLTNAGKQMFFATMVKSERAAGSGSTRVGSQLRNVDSEL